MTVVVKTRFLVIDLTLIAQLAICLFVGNIPQETSELLWHRIGAMIALSYYHPL